MFITFVMGVIGFFAAFFGFSKIALPLFYSLPKVFNMVKRGELKRSAIKKCTTIPIILTVIIVGLYFLANYFNSGVWFLRGLSLGVAFHIFRLFRPETWKDIKEEFAEFICHYITYEGSINLLDEGMQSDIKNGHLATSLKCPRCDFKGVVTYNRNDFKILGKDKEGYLYFGCPDCKSHLKYDSLTKIITIVKF